MLGPWHCAQPLLMPACTMRPPAKVVAPPRLPRGRDQLRGDGLVAGLAVVARGQECGGVSEAGDMMRTP